jgi:hypothetical protein
MTGRQLLPSLMLLALVGGSGNAAARINKCVINPFECCPSPCPVSDARTHDLLTDSNSLFGSVEAEVRGIRDAARQWREITGSPQLVGKPIVGLYDQYPPLWQQATKGASPESLAEVRRILDARFTLSPQERGKIATPYTWMRPLPKAVQVIDERVTRGPDQRTWYAGIDIDTAQTLQRAEQRRGTMSQSTDFGLDVPSTVPNQVQRDEPWGPIYGNPVPPEPPTTRPRSPLDQLRALLDLLAKLAIQLALSKTATTAGPATANLQATQQTIAALVNRLTGLLGQTYENPAAAAQALIALASSQDPTTYLSGAARDPASIAAATAAAQAFVNTPAQFGLTRPVICDGSGADKVCGLPMAPPEMVQLVLAELRNQQKYAGWIGSIAALETSTRTAAAETLVEAGGTPSPAEFSTVLNQAIALADQLSPATAAALRTGTYIVSITEL